MKPKDLKCPFSWKEREVLLKDKVWYVPGHLTEPQNFQFPGWDHSEIFGNSNPVFVEYCSGNGAWVVEKAKENREINWVAIELKFERVRRIWSKVKNGNITNLLVICGEGGYVTANYFSSGSIERVYINFPDPWPKRRHAKHRIVTPPFIAELSRILKNSGVLTIVTDDARYSSEITKTFTQQRTFLSLHNGPYIDHLENYGTSYFDQLWRDQGKTIRYHQYERQGKVS